MTDDRESIVDRLRAAGSVFAEEEAALLAAEADGAALEAMVARRIRGEPLEVVVGWALFRGRRILVAPGVFVPRRRTELVVETALDLPALADPASDALVLDLCCGTGAVGAAIESARPRARVYAADLDPAAVAVARTNLRHPERVFEGDLYSALPDELRGRIRLVLANAPYVPSDEIAFLPREAREHEPLAALDGGATGTELHGRIARGAREWLAPGGAVVIETSPGQEARTAGHLDAAGLRTVTRRDDDLDATVVVGVDTEST